jgi:hypothetical protein
LLLAERVVCYFLVFVLTMGFLSWFFVESKTFQLSEAEKGRGGVGGLLMLRSLLLGCLPRWRNWFERQRRMSSSARLGRGVKLL